jgi:hypothetical protein
MTSTAPAYDSGWATEIALDVQWARHRAAGAHRADRGGQRQLRQPAGRRAPGQQHGPRHRLDELWRQRPAA